MRALLVLYMVKLLLLPGMRQCDRAWRAQEPVQSVSGSPTCSPSRRTSTGSIRLVYLTPVFAACRDRVSPHRTILLGAAMMAIGHS